MTFALHSLESLFTWLLQASWQASVLVALVRALQLALRGKLNPRWNHALWLLVIARLLLPVLPESALSLFQFAPPPPPALAQTVTEPIFPSAPVESSPAPMVPASTPAHPISAYTLLALLWLAGAFVLFIFTWHVNRRFARQVLRTPPLADPHLLAIAAAAQSELGLHHPLRLIESAHVQGPAIMGLLHSTLILPERAREKFTDDELRFIFLHEFAHLKRGDLLLQWLIALLQILHWFNPVLWYALRRMRADREPATDALVLSRTGEAQKEPYGHVLLKLLEHYHTRNSLPTLVGILEDKDQFKRRFTLISRYTRGAYGWSLLGVMLIAGLGIACLTKAKASENSRTAHDLIMDLGRFVDGVDSLDYSETRGDPKGVHSYAHWQEFGALERIEILSPSVDHTGKTLGTFHRILSYDGDYAYMYKPGDDRLFRQKEPFADLTEGYSSGLEGPLLPFEFLDKRGARSSSGRVTLQTLKSPDALTSVAARAMLAPDKNRSWQGHPCIAVKITDGNDGGDSQAKVDFIAYFAPDLDFYPVAYEIYKHGKLSASYEVEKFATFPIAGHPPFRYPALAKGFRYDSDTFHSSSGHGYSYELSPAPDLKINTLSKSDFTLAPPPGGYIEDRDTQKLIKVPSAEKADTTSNKIIQVLGTVLPGEKSHHVPVQFAIPEDDVPQVMRKLDAKQYIKIEAYDHTNTTKIGEGLLVGADNQIDASTGTLTCRGIITTDPQTILLPNMLLNIRLYLEENSAALQNPPSPQIVPPKSETATPPTAKGILTTRTFLLPANFSLAANGTAADLQQILSERGVQLPNATPVKLVVRGTPEQLDRIESEIDSMPTPTGTAETNGSPLGISSEPVPDWNPTPATRLISRGADGQRDVHPELRFDLRLEVLPSFPPPPPHVEEPMMESMKKGQRFF